MMATKLQRDLAITILWTEWARWQLCYRPPLSERAS